MGRRVAREPLERERAADQARVGLVLLLERFEIRHQLERARERHSEIGRDHLRHAIDVGVGHPERAPHVANDGARRHGAERDDLAHALPAVLRDHVIDHLLARLVREIDVDVGHADPLRIQEPLEQEVEPDRIDVGDAEAVGDEAPRGRAATRPDGDAVPARVVGEVADDQEIARVADGADRVELVGEPRVVHLAGFRSVAALEPLGRELLQIVLLALDLGRDREGRKLHALGVERELAALRDRERVPERLGRVPEERFHLLGRLHVELVGREAKAVGIQHRLPGLDAEEHLVRLRVLAGEVVAVVGRDDRDPHLPAQGENSPRRGLLVGEPVVLNFQEVVIGAEEIPVPRRRAPRPVRVAGDHELRHLAPQAGAQAEEPARVPGQELLVDPRLVVKSLQVPRGGELGEVLVSLAIPHQQDQVVVRSLPVRRPGAVLPGSVRDVDLAAQDRLDPGSEGLVIELHGAE